MIDIIENLMTSLKATRYTNLNNELSDWEMIGSWVEESEADWHFPKLAWEYIEALINHQIEEASYDELLALMGDAFSDRNLR